MIQFLLENYVNSAYPFLTGAACAAFISFVAMLVAGRLFILYARKHMRAGAREDTPETHRAKDFTPTMGGVCIVAVVVATMFLCGVWTEDATILVLGLVSFCCIGMWDDLAKIRYRKGISERKKFIAQVAAATCVVLLWFWWVEPSTYIEIPCFSAWSFDVGPLLYLLWAVWVIACTVNAVNFTDGLDGLATLTLGANFALFALIAVLVWLESVGLFICAVGGALLGFLWYNAYPAELFMGDAGSLSLGAVLALVALMTKTELLIPLAGGIFFVEGISVAAQILCFKATGRRLLKMSPIHHHFELMGYPETKITMRFFIVTLLLCSIAFFLFLIG